MIDIPERLQSVNKIIQILLKDERKKVVNILDGATHVESKISIPAATPCKISSDKIKPELE